MIPYSPLPAQSELQAHPAPNCTGNVDRFADSVTSADAAPDATVTPRSFGQLAPALAVNGYRPVPLRPSQKNPILSGWQNYTFTDGDEKKWPDAGTGLLTGEIIAVDVDVLDKDLADRVSGIVVQRLGAAPMRNSPRRRRAPTDCRVTRPMKKVIALRFSQRGSSSSPSEFTPIPANRTSGMAPAIHWLFQPTILSLSAKRRLTPLLPS
jgi:hypothetical protein